VVAERMVDEGSMVAANAPIVTVVDLDPVVVVVFVTEVDYGLLSPGVEVSVTTDAYPDDRFVGTISRIAPVFRTESRQARVEITVANADGRLKPGMFGGLAASTLLTLVLIPAVYTLVHRERGGASS
jgi:multidrug efflux pump subunit AcrA (membrane-fusion protein)